VSKIIRILHELSLQAATPDEARELLALKGADRTKIPRVRETSAIDQH